MRELIADGLIVVGLAAIVKAAWDVSPVWGIAGIGIALIGVGLVISRGKHDSERD